MVTQDPKYQVTRVGKPVTLNCFQDLNHDTMYWYQQKLSQAPKLLFYYYDTQLNKEPDTSDNFQPNRPNASFCSVDIGSPGLGDSATYLCASSRGTERERCLPSAQKPPLPRPRAFPRPPTLLQQGQEAVLWLSSPLQGEAGHKPTRAADSYAKSGAVVSY